jgi:hypothetical protein
MTRQLHLAVVASSGSRSRGARKHLARRPSSLRSPRSLSFRPLARVVRQTFATSFSRLLKRHPQRYMGARHPCESARHHSRWAKRWGDGCAVAQVRRASAAKPHHRGHPHQLAPPGALVHLAINQLCCHLPLRHVPSSTNHLEPLSEMSREGREGEIEAITGEEGDAERRPRALAVRG